MMKTDQYDRYHIIDPQHPYAGLYSFRETDSEYFFGRKRETTELVNLIADNVLTVVFGKSGIGKTSLLCAGLTPYTRKNYYLPIYLRIDFSNEQKHPVQQVKETITQKIIEMDPQVKPVGDLTLWEYFSTVQIQRGFVKPLLVFDQFEEMFTTGRNNTKHVKEFVTELADLIENRVPLKVSEKLNDEKRGISLLDSRCNLRIIISLREDYLAQMEALYKEIPSLRPHQYRFRVLQMKGIDAKEAVLKPGKEIIKDPAVAEAIIKKIPSSKDADYTPYDDKADSWKNKKIEPFLLSLFCYQVNEKRLEKKAAEISNELVTGMNAEGIIKDYYNENISRLKPEVKAAIEDLLVTAEGYRKLQDLNSLKTGYGIMDKDIEGLIDRRIIRKETRCDVEYIELIHDVLAPILKESRDKRIEAEKRKKNRRIIAVISAVILVILTGLTGFLLYQKAEIKKEKQRAQVEERKGLAYERAAYSIDALQKDRRLSFRLAESAFNTDPNNLVAYRALLSVFYDGGIANEIINNKNNEFAKTVSEKADFFAAFSPDGKHVLTTVSNKAVLWNLEGGQWHESKQFQPPVGLELNPNAAFSPDGNHIIICTKSNDAIILWDLANNQMKPLTLEGGVNSVAISPAAERTMIAAACRDKKVRLFNLSGKTMETFAGHTGGVNSVSFSCDGQYIVSAGWDAVRRWDITGKQIRETFQENGKGFSGAAFSPDGQSIVTAGLDGTVQLWDLKDNRKRPLGTHKEAVTSAVFSPDGRFILTGSEDRTVRFLTRNNFLVFEFKGFADIINSAVFSPDGKHILIAPARGPAQLRLIDPQEIIHQVNNKGNIKPLSADEKETYNLRDP
jgi:DNA-binding beta-propeller fold protein YncE